MFNIIISIVLVVAIGLWCYKMYSDRKKSECHAWPDIEGYGEAKEYFFEGMEAPVVLPQYGYYHFRTSYLVNRQIPCIVTEAELVGDVVGYAFTELDKGEKSMDSVNAFALLGRVKPEIYTKY